MDDKNEIFAKVHDEVIRSADVQSEVSDFSSLMVPPSICDLLRRHNYLRPTPVQAKAIPLLMFGSDMLVQAKAGTGKTLVFSILASKLLHDVPKTNSPLVLIVTPTRETALQSFETMNRLLPSNYTAGLFVGGLRETEYAKHMQLLSQGVQVVVGTCGRLKDLVERKKLKLNKIQLFVLDEADLLAKDFVPEVNFLFSMLPPEMKQVCVFSATYPNHLEETLKNYMKSPTLLRLSNEGEQLIALLEYVVVCDAFGKLRALKLLLQKLIFKQCVIFCGTIEFQNEIRDFLQRQQIDCERLSSGIDQSQRFAVLKKFRERQIRILVATDLVARGLDFPGVDLVINVSIASDSNTHMHREGRGGRYGARCLAISLLGSPKEIETMEQFVRTKNLMVKRLDIYREDLPYNLIENIDYFNFCPDFAQIQYSDDHIKVGDLSLNEREVPERSTTRRVCYLRAEMLRIRDSLSTTEWQEYAKNEMEIADGEFIADGREPPSPQPFTSAGGLNFEERERKRRAERAQRREVLNERARQKPPIREVVAAAGSSTGKPTVIERPKRSEYQQMYMSGVVPKNEIPKSELPFTWTSFSQFKDAHDKKNAELMVKRDAHSTRVARGAKCQQRQSVANHRDRLFQLDELHRSAVQPMSK